MYLEWLFIVFNEYEFFNLINFEDTMFVECLRGGLIKILLMGRKYSKEKINRKENILYIFYYRVTFIFPIGILVKSAVEVNCCV